MSDVVSPSFWKLYNNRSHAFWWLRLTTSLIKAVNASLSMGLANVSIMSSMLQRLTIVAKNPAADAEWGAGIGAAAWPILVGLAAIAGEGVAIGAGYYAAGEKITDEACKSGYAHGIVLGALREGWPLVQQFVIRRPRTWNYQFFPAGAAIEQKHYDAAMTLGYSDGVALRSSQSQTLWSEMAKAGGAIAGGGRDGTTPNWAFYAEAAGRFRMVFLS